MINLDKIAAGRAQSMVNSAQKVDTLERLVTKSLGVLQEQGIYALIIFLFSRTGDEATEGIGICRELYLALSALPAYQTNQELTQLTNGKPQPKTGLDFFSDHVLNNLDTILLVRDLYEQTLIYARYHARAIGKQT